MLVIFIKSGVPNLNILESLPILIYSKCKNYLLVPLERQIDIKKYPKLVNKIVTCLRKQNKLHPKPIITNFTTFFRVFVLCTVYK